ncbi:MAG: hypothetical protein ACRDBH_04675 [Bosea sp. (in: a-proteobacteria)]
MIKLSSKFIFWFVGAIVLGILSEAGKDLYLLIKYIDSKSIVQIFETIKNSKTSSSLFISSIYLGSFVGSFMTVYVLHFRYSFLKNYQFFVYNLVASLMFSIKTAIIFAIFLDFFGFKIDYAQLFKFCLPIILLAASRYDSEFMQDIKQKL